MGTFQVTNVCCLSALSMLLLAGACSDSSDPISSDAGNPDSRTQVPVDARPGLDATPANLECSPGVIGDPLTLSGAVEDLIGNNAASGVTLGVYPVGATTPIQEVTTTSDGLYDLSIPTGGEPWVGEIRSTSESGKYIPMHIFPSGLNVDTTDLNLPALTPNALNLAGLAAGVTINPEDALVIAYIYDCDKQGIEGATITQNLTTGEQAYLVDDAPYLDNDATSTSPTGAAIILNASSDSGKALIGASHNDRTWEVEVDVVPGEISIAIFLP